jgi:hypothetical protein
MGELSIPATALTLRPQTQHAHVHTAAFRNPIGTTAVCLASDADDKLATDLGDLRAPAETADDHAELIAWVGRSGLRTDHAVFAARAGIAMPVRAQRGTGVRRQVPGR